MSSNSITSWPQAAFRSPSLVPSSPREAGVADRQDRIPGFDTAALKRATVLIIGCGGVGGEISTALSRKGLGRLVFSDHDVVELSNLARQHFFARDLYQPKAIALARNVARESCLGTECIGHAVGFLPETAATLAAGVDLAVVGVDNDATRCLASQFFGQRGIPAVFTAVNDEATWCWAFVQESVSPCIACLFPFMAKALTEPEPCRDAPGLINILKAAAALVSHAVDSLLTRRPRAWTYYDFNLVGDAPNCADRIRPRPGCPLCGTSGAKA